jgi:RNA recognition motif-containing protein
MVKRKRDENKIIVVGLPEGTDGDALEAMFVGVGKVYAAHVVGFEPSSGKSRGYGFVTFAEEASCLAAVAAMHKTVVEGRTINVRLVEDRGEDTKAVLEPGKGVGVGKDANKVPVDMSGRGLGLFRLTQTRARAERQYQTLFRRHYSREVKVSRALASITPSLTLPLPRRAGFPPFLSPKQVLVAGLSQSMTDERLQLICEEFGLVLKATVVCHPVTGKSKGFGFVTFTNRACQQACIAKLDKRELGGGRTLNVRAVETRVPDTADPDGGGQGGAGGAGGDGLEAAAGGKKKAAASKESPEDASKPLCVKFQTNKCHRGRACRWRHVKVTDAKAYNEKLAAAAAAAEGATAGAAEAGTAALGGGAAVVSKRGAKKGWGGEAVEAKTTGDLGSESEDEDAVSGGGSSSGKGRANQAPAAPAAAQASKSKSDEKASGKTAAASLPASAVSVAGKAVATTEFGGWSDESEDEAHHAKGSNVVDFSDDDDDDEGVYGNNYGAMAASAGGGTTAFDFDEEDAEEGGRNAAVGEPETKTTAFDDDEDDEDAALIPRAPTVSSKPQSNPKGAKRAKGKCEQVTAESHRAALEAEASQALSIMASLFAGGDSGSGMPAKQKKATKVMLKKTGQSKRV